LLKSNLSKENIRLQRLGKAIGVERKQLERLFEAERHKERRIFELVKSDQESILRLKFQARNNFEKPRTQRSHETTDNADNPNLNRNTTQDIEKDKNDADDCEATRRLCDNVGKLVCSQNRKNSVTVPLDNNRSQESCHKIPINRGSWSIN
jgi:hypothetical protein